MIQQDNATADVTPAWIVIAGDQRTHTGISPQNAGLRHDRRQFFPFAQQDVHLFGGDAVAVDILVINVRRGGPNQGNGIAGHQNVSVGRLTAAVDDVIVDAVIEDQQRAFGREHANGQLGIFGNTLPPDPRGVHYHTGVQLAVFAVEVVVDAYAPHSVAFADQPRHFMRG
ncbi:hypothetical protein D3C71_1410070 [compost metagenome]